MAGMLDILVEKIIDLQEAIDNWLSKLPESLEPYIDILVSPINLPIVVDLPFEIRVLTAITFILLITFILMVFINTVSLFYPSINTLSKWESKKATKAYEKGKRKKEAKAFKLYKKQTKKNDLKKDKGSDITKISSIKKKKDTKAIDKVKVENSSVDNLEKDYNKKRKNTNTSVMGLFEKKNIKINQTPTTVASPKNLRKGRESDDESFAYSYEKSEQNSEYAVNINYNTNNFSPLEFKKAKKEQEKKAMLDRKEQIKREKYEAKRNKNKSVSKPKIVEKRIEPTRAPIITPTRHIETIKPNELNIENLNADKKNDPSENLIAGGIKNKRNSFDHLDELLQNGSIKDDVKETVTPVIEETTIIAVNNSDDDDDDDDELQVEQQVLITHNSNEIIDLQVLEKNDDAITDTIIEPNVIEPNVIVPKVIEPILVEPKVIEQITDIIEPIKEVEPEIIILAQEIEQKIDQTIIESTKKIIVTEDDDLNNFFEVPKKEAEQEEKRYYSQKSTSLDADGSSTNENEISEAKEKIINRKKIVNTSPYALDDDEIGDIDAIIEEIQLKKDMEIEDNTNNSEETVSSEPTLNEEISEPTLNEEISEPTLIEEIPSSQPTLIVDNKIKIRVQEANSVTHNANESNLLLKQDQFEILEGDDKYFFILISENGDTVFSSNSYKTLPSCMNGIQTFKKNIRTGDFIIEKDKFGSCKFLLTSKNNKLVKYYGELFRTEEECINNIQEVKRLAQIIPTYEIVQGENGFAFVLTSDSGDTIFISRDYKTLSSCMNGTITFKKNVLNGIFEICKDEETEDYMFVLSSKANNLVKYYGIPFKSAEECTDNIEEVKQFSNIAQIKVRNY